MEQIIPIEAIEKRILLVRGQKIMLDADLAEMYGVQTRVLNQAVKRNIDRFPEDFMFRLTADEATRLRSQIVTLKTGRGQHRKYAPFAFTEHGALMAASVLNTKRAADVSVFVIRAFVRLREMIASHKALATKLAELERKLEGHDVAIQSVVRAIQTLMQPEGPLKKRKIGFIQETAK